MKKPGRAVASPARHGQPHRQRDTGPLPSAPEAGQVPGGMCGDALTVPSRRGPRWRRLGYAALGLQRAAELVGNVLATERARRRLRAVAPEDPADPPCRRQRETVIEGW